MARQQILLTRTFTVDAHQHNFTAIERGGVMLVEFSVSTLSEAVPLLILEKPRIDQYSACYYVENITERAANKLLEYFGSELAAVVGLDADMLKEAIEKAQLQRTILLAKAKTDAPQPDPELVATEPAAEPHKAE